MYGVKTGIQMIVFNTILPWWLFFFVEKTLVVPNREKNWLIFRIKWIREREMKKLQKPKKISWYKKLVKSPPNCHTYRPNKNDHPRTKNYPLLSFFNLISVCRFVNPSRAIFYFSIHSIFFLLVFFFCFIWFNEFSLIFFFCKFGFVSLTIIS